MNFKNINHIQFCIPKGEEQKGRDFYSGILRLKEIKKPARLINNGGFWLEFLGIQLHIGTGVMEGKSKRHAAFEVDNLKLIKTYLPAQGIKIKEDGKIPRISRLL